MKGYYYIPKGGNIFSRILHVDDNEMLLEFWTHYRQWVHYSNKYYQLSDFYTDERVKLTKEEVDEILFLDNL